MPNENDRASRQEFGARVRIKVSGEEAVQRGYAQNLSSGGLFVRCDEPPPVDTLVLIEFVMPDGNALSRVTARVVHAKRALTRGDKTAGMGLRFVELDDVAASIAASEPLDDGKPSSCEAPRTEWSSSGPMSLEAGDRAPLISAAGTTVGIDLGTVLSCVAVVKDGEPRILTSKHGYDAVPSVVYVGEEGEPIVGHRAVERIVLAPERVVFGAKRFIGRPFSSQEVKNLGHFFHYRLVSGPNQHTAVQIDDRAISLEEISAHILRELRSLAQHAIESDVRRAVITVPAYFDQPQRQAVRDAGRMAGLFVERIIDEPTAAALSWAWKKKFQGVVLVYDLGGGTCDISILRIQDRAFEVLAVGGDPFLGGSDFDDRLTEFVLQDFEKKNGIALREQRDAVQRVRFACQMTKQQLSDATTSYVEVPFVAVKDARHVDLRCKITRPIFDGLIDDLVERTLVIVDSVLKQASLGSKDLDRVLFIGGQTRTPLVKERVAQRIGAEAVTGINPDKAVALGAALVAHGFQEKQPVRIQSIVPVSIRLGLDDGTTRQLIRQGTKLPAEVKFKLRPQASANAEVRIPLYRGEADLAEKNSLIGIVKVQGLPPEPDEDPFARVTLRIDREGILTIKARHPGTGELVERDLSLLQ